MITHLQFAAFTVAKYLCTHRAEIRNGCHMVIYDCVLNKFT